MELELDRLYTIHNVGELQVIATSTRAIIPTKRHTHPASYILYSPSNFTVPAGRTLSVSTDLCVSNI